MYLQSNILRVELIVWIIADLFAVKVKKSVSWRAAYDITILEKNLLWRRSIICYTAQQAAVDCDVPGSET